jgi:pyruvate dehydrogenase E1 component
VVSSADRLSAGWHGAQRARERGDAGAIAHVEHLLADLPRDAVIITVCDAYPETLSWIGSVNGHRVRALGPEHFGQSGNIHDLYAHHGFGVDGILAAAEGLGGRKVRYRKS